MFCKWNYDCTEPLSLQFLQEKTPLNEPLLIFHATRRNISGLRCTKKNLLSCLLSQQISCNWECQWILPPTTSTDKGASSGEAKKVQSESLHSPRDDCKGRKSKHKQHKSEFVSCAWWRTSLLRGLPGLQKLLLPWPGLFATLCGDYDCGTIRPLCHSSFLEYELP